MLRQVVFGCLVLGAFNMVQATPEKRDAGERASDARDKVICKKFLETGSLVKGTRVCKTKREWEISRAQFREGASGSGNACPYAGASPGC